MLWKNNYKYICAYIGFSLALAFASIPPVFAQVMKSDNYRLELEEGEIAPVEGFQGKTATEKTDQGFVKNFKDKLLSSFLSSFSPDHPDFWKAVLLVGTIVILLALFACIVARNWSLKRKQNNLR